MMSCFSFATFIPPLNPHPPQEHLQQWPGEDQLQMIESDIYNVRNYLKLREKHHSLFTGKQIEKLRPE